MKDRSVAGQLARKMKLEEKLKPKLRKFFDRIGLDVRSVWIATRSIPNLNSFNLELTAILRDHYRAISKEFSTVTRNDLKSSNSIFKIKQEENIDKEIVVYINEHSQEQSDLILRTTERNLQNISRTIITDAATNGIILTNEEVGNQILSEFNSNSGNRIDTIAVTETQTVSEMIKFIEASTIASIISLIPGTQEIFKTWNTVLDEKTRASHVEADRQRKNINQPFTVQGQKLRIPGDPGLGASQDNIINCRCTAIFNVEGEESPPLDIPRRQIPLRAVSNPS